MRIQRCYFSRVLQSLHNCFRKRRIKRRYKNRRIRQSLLKFSPYVIRTHCPLLLIEYSPVNYLIFIPFLLHNFLNDIINGWSVHRGWDYHPSFSFPLFEERQRRLLRGINRDVVSARSLKEIDWVFR